MSLPNVPKIDWGTGDGVQNTDMNEIGENLNHLEDVKYEADDDMTIGVITPTASPVSTTEVISGLSVWIIPRGLYNISLGNTPVSNSVKLQINVGGWVDMAVRTTTSAPSSDSMGTAIFSDGTNTRVNNLDSNAYTVSYQKF